MRNTKGIWHILKQRYSTFIKTISLSLGMVVFVFYSTLAKADACVVTDPGGVANGTVDVTGSFNTLGDNLVGSVKDIDISSSNTVESKKAICHCSSGDSKSLWDWTSFNLPTEEVDGYTYGIINDYIEVAIKAGDSANQTWVPYENHEHVSKKNVCDKETTTGGGGYIARIRIRKRIVGVVNLGNTLVYTKGSNTYSTDTDRVAEIIYRFTGSIIVPQNCELDAGQIVDMNFGNIGASLFSQAGAGNKPDGVMPMSKNIQIQCNKIDAQTMLSLRIQGEDVKGNIMVSDNKDVGFILTDKDNHPITPGDVNSKIEFRLDDNASANVTIAAYPVSVTGNKPAEGDFVARGYLRVDFD
jgi:minor fimbrial subunit